MTNHSLCATVIIRTKVRNKEEYTTYPKKFGLIKRNITPEAHKIASPTATLTIISLPHLGLPVAIITPATTISTNEVIKMTLMSILVSIPIKRGKASPSFNPLVAS